MSEPEEIEEAVTEAFRALGLRQWATGGAKVLGDALVWMGYAVWRTGPDGKPGIQPDREKFIVDAAAAGYYGDTGLDKFLAERTKEYLEQHEEGDA